MYYNTTRKLVYGLITAGIVLIIYGLMQFLISHDFSSIVSESVVAVKGWLFPILGIIISSIGFIILKLISEVEDESLSIRQELIQLRKLAEKNLNDKH